MNKTLLPLPAKQFGYTLQFLLTRATRTLAAMKKKEHYFCMEEIGTTAIKAKKTVPTNKHYIRNQQTDKTMKPTDKS